MRWTRLPPTWRGSSSAFVPIVGIVLFWLVHVMPEKIAHKRHHPQRDAIHTLCLLSLAFGGLLWPIAWLWAYTKPVAYRIGYGTEKHEDYYHEMGDKAHAGELLEHELAHLREELDAMAAKGTLSAKLQGAAPGSGQGAARVCLRLIRKAPGRLMEVLLLAIYAFFVWLIFIKLKWLPWNTTSQVIVVIIPIVAMAALILTLECGGTVDERRAGDQVRRAGHSAGAGTRDRGAGRAQSAGQARASCCFASTRRSTRMTSTSPRRSSRPTRRSSRRQAPTWSTRRPARGKCRSS